MFSITYDNTPHTELYTPLCTLYTELYIPLTVHCAVYSIPHTAPLCTLQPSLLVPEDNIYSDSSTKESEGCAEGVLKYYIIV